ncbi:MAG: hypothetical protein IKZ83_05695, partial [Prevotella sp.]|nr:hypothetical protein [Prevotella sp.]
IELTPELIEEGIARELINRLQNLRKSSGLDITDRIRVEIVRNEVINNAVEHCGEYIASQVLADSIEIAQNDGAEIDFDDFKLNIKIEKV